MARPEGLLLPLGTPGRDSPCPWRKGLQRPLELVPRQVLPDGGLGAGGIPQFSPDHLGQRGGVSGAPRPPEPTAATHVPPRAPRPQSPEARRGQRPRRHRTILVATPVIPSESPLGRRLGLGLPSGPGDPGGSRRGGLRPAPPKALAQPRGTTLPRWLLQGSRHASVRGAAGREARVSPLPRAKAAPALQTHGLEAPACTTGAATRGASQLGGRPEARPLGLARGLGHMGSTRPVPRGRGTLPGQACGDQEPHSQGRVPGSTASSRPSRPPACPRRKAAATSRTAPGPGARPHPGPPPRPGPTRSASHCTSHGRWPSPPRSGHPRGCPGAAAPGSRAPPGPAGDGAQGQGPGDLQGRPSSLTVPFPLAPVTV